MNFLAEGFFPRQLVPQKRSEEIEDFGSIPEPTSKGGRGLQALLGGSARLGEGVVGGLGNLLSLPEDAREAIFEAANVPEEIRETARGYSLGTPTRELRSLTKAATGEYLEPKSSLENNAQEYLTIVGELLSPVPGGAGKAAQEGVGMGKQLFNYLKRTATTAAKGYAGQKGAEALGGGPLMQSLAFLTLASARSPQGVAKEAKNVFYDSMTKSLPADARVGRGSWKVGMDEVRDVLKLGGETGFDKSLSKQLESLSSQQTRGLGPTVESVLEAKQKINGLYPKASEIEQRTIGRVVEKLNKVLEEYGESNPTFGKNLRAGDELHGALREAKKAAPVLTKAFEKMKAPKNPLVYAVMGAFSPTVGKIGGALAGGAAVSKYGIEAFHLLSKSKGAREALSKAVKSGAKGNVTAAAHWLTKLNKNFDEYDDGWYLLPEDEEEMTDEVEILD